MREYRFIRVRKGPPNQHPGISRSRPFICHGKTTFHKSNTLDFDTLRGAEGHVKARNADGSKTTPFLLLFDY